MNALERKQQLLNAVKSGDLRLLKALLNDGGNANSIYPDGKTLLVVAVEAQNSEIVESLIQAQANLDQRDFSDRTPLMHAADNTKVSIAQRFIEAGADLNAKNRDGRTALMYAAYHDSLEITECLLNAGADINARDHKDRSALNYSVYKKGRKCHGLLTARGAEVREPRVSRQTTGFIRNILSMDEFTELRVHSRSEWEALRSGWDTIRLVFAALESGFKTLVFFLMLLFLFIIQSIFGALSWLYLLVAAWLLLFEYPSILKIFPLGWEIVQTRFRPSRAAPPASLPARQNIGYYADLTFVGRLMDLGTKELAAIHLTHPTPQSLQSKVLLLYSRAISVLLAVSIFATIVVLFRHGLFGMNLDWYDVFFSLNSPYLWISVILPFWIWIANSLEYRLRRRRLQLVQQERDRSAGEIAQLLSAEDFREKELPPDFGLYLRAFMTTDRLHMKGFDLETMLAYSIAPTLPLLALGKPGEHLGSGRIQTTDEHWQEEILRLMDAARLILIIPSHRAGTLWEICTLRDRGYFEKTIFIMPPELSFRGGRYSEDWQKTVVAAQGYGVEFPNHIPAGALFRLNGNGEFEEFVPFVPVEFMREFESGSDEGGPGLSDAGFLDRDADGSNFDGETDDRAGAGESDGDLDLDWD